MNILFGAVIVVGAVGAIARVGMRVAPKVKGMFGMKGSGIASSTNTGFYSEMTRDEALTILNVEDKATLEQIKVRHRTMMIKNHPDSGGSTYISTKINEAKDFLTGKDKK